MFDLGFGNAIVLSAHNGWVPFVGSVGVAGKHIRYVSEKLLHASDCREYIDCSGKILMAGLVNGHCHGDMTVARGLGDDLTLAEQNEAFADTNWFKTILSDEDRYVSRQLTYAEALLSGTTFILENMYWGLGLRSVEAMRESGIRGGLAEDIRYDFAEPEVLLSDNELAAFGRACNEADLLPVIGGISEEDYQPELLRRILATVRRHGFLLTCLLAENNWREEIVQTKYGTTSVDFLAKTGVLDPCVIGSHAIYIDEAEIALMAAHDVKVVNTPLCEMKIADGIAPIPGFVRGGVTVGLGTDGAMWNNSNDIFREMKGMALLHTINSGIRTLTTTELLDMATVNGARVFGIEDRVGTVEAGKEADLILIDAAKPHLRPLRTGIHENISSAVVFAATGADVESVWVRGECVVRERELLTMDLDRLMEDADEIADRIAKGIS